MSTKYQVGVKPAIFGGALLNHDDSSNALKCCCIASMGWPCQTGIFAMLLLHCCEVCHSSTPSWRSEYFCYFIDDDTYNSIRPNSTPFSPFSVVLKLLKAYSRLVN